MTTIIRALTILIAVVVLPSWAVSGTVCPVVKLEVERLPDLNIPRSGHHTFLVGNDVVVMGGHTSGFVPTPTAEYYSGGEWHQIPMVYPHDQGLALLMKSGKVLIAGGHEQPLGIGQLFSMELYDGVTHSFEGYGCMDKKRCFANAVEMDSGMVVISGNWYEEDGVECFNGSRQNVYVKDVYQQRSLPYVFRTSKDNAIMFGKCDNHAVPLDTIVVDRLQGKSFTVPLFEKWRPLYHHMMPHGADCFIGDEAKGLFAYLLTVTDSAGQVGFVKVEGEEFSLLPTRCPVPMEFEGDSITYFSYVIVDRRCPRAYLVGIDNLGHDSRVYVLAVDYQKEPADIVLYYTDKLSGIGMCQPVLMPDGNLLMAGGTIGNNYNLCASAWLLYVGTDSSHAYLSSFWIWGLLILAVVGGLAFLIMVCGRRHRSSSVELTEQTMLLNEQLLQRICQLMDEEHLYLDSDLKIADVARRLNTNSAYVSASINTLRGCTFSQFINSYRVSYAQQLLQRNPDKKLLQVSLESGFATETSFFRNFKSATGMTPKEWLKVMM